MENSGFLKKTMRRSLLASVIGAVLCGTGAWLSLAGPELFHSNGESGWLFLCMLVYAISWTVADRMGLPGFPQGIASENIDNAIPFSVALFAVVGAIIFGVLALLWHLIFLTKQRSDSQPQ